ncbi:hypothetical protein K7432_016583 [Basidiobolus ranarum]|uniref:Uncharacterized protein n=1 Tax=Basidiobolus ranarum TaxID=34480 RepID=A0ABR2WEI8_9FUNG
MFEHREDLSRHEGVSAKKKNSTGVEPNREITPKKSVSRKNLSAILETLSPSKRSLFEKRGVIRSTHKVAFLEELELGETSTPKKKKKKNKASRVGKR